MKTLLAVHSRDGVISPDSIPGLITHAEIGWPFRSQSVRRQSWLSSNQRLLLVIWETDPANPNTPLILTKGDRAWTSTGFIAAPDCSNGWDISAAAAHIPWTDKEAITLGGSFLLIEANNDPPRLTLRNTVARLEPLYWAESDGLTILSSSALVCNLLLTGRTQKPLLEVENLPPFLVNGYYLSEQTPFWGVKVLPGNSRMTVDHHGVTVVPLNDLSLTAGKRGHDASLVPEIAKALQGQMRSTGGTPVSLALSGGIDSRILAAALHSTDTPFRVHTRGFPNHPDVVGATLVANALGIPHRVGSPEISETAKEQSMQINLASRIQDNLRKRDCMIFGWESLRTLNAFNGTEIAMLGSGAVSLKGGWNWKLKPGEALDWDDALAILGTRLRNRANLFNKDALEHHLALAEANLPLRRNLSPASFLDLYGIEYRIGRWGTGLRAATYNQPTLYPFEDNQIVRLGLTISHETKVNQRFLFDLLDFLHPSLTTIPLAGKRWKFEQEGPLPGDEAGWTARTPLQAAAESQGGFEWRYTWTSAMYDAFRDQIFQSGSASRIFQVVNRNALDRWFEEHRGKDPGVMATHFAWSVFTASVMFENRWLLQDLPPLVVKIRVPQVESTS